MPNLDGLDLDAAGVAHDARGVTVDRGLRSVSNRRVYAIGDVAGGLQFTHVAGHQAGLVIRSALFRLPARYDRDIVPWVTFTDPELAQAGLTEAAGARPARPGRDRALLPSPRTTGRAPGAPTEGLVKAVIGRRGRILGASIAGAHAGELIHPWALALSKGLKIGDMAGYVAALPDAGRGLETRRRRLFRAAPVRKPDREIGCAAAFAARVSYLSGERSRGWRNVVCCAACPGGS